MSRLIDVDKVIEELELHSFEFGTDTLPAHYVRLNDAIEIFRNAEEEVCEWKMPPLLFEDGNEVFEVQCNENPLKYKSIPNNFSFMDFKYCPYCGKKIKVVE